MAEWVAVCAEENAEAVEIPTEQDGEDDDDDRLVKEKKTYFFRESPPVLSDCTVPWSHRPQVQEPRH